MNRYLSAAVFAAATCAMPIAAHADTPINVTMIIYTAQSVEFWVPAIRGAKDAAAQQGVNLDIQYGDSDPVKQNNLIEAALANKVDGIALAIYDDSAFDKNICAAEKLGVHVVAFNVDDSQGAAGNCREAFVGQNFPDTGYLIAKRMIKDNGIKSGDLVYAPVELPTAVYATLRYQGVERALKEVGAHAEMVATGFDLAGALNTSVQYLVGHPDTAAIIALGSVPLTTAPKAVKEAGHSIPIGGFDLTPEIIDGIAGGSITATVDQQPYSQGFFAITQLALEVKYGLFPSDMNTGGLGLVDKTNVEKVRSLTGNFR